LPIYHLSGKDHRNQTIPWNFLWMPPPMKLSSPDEMSGLPALALSLNITPLGSTMTSVSWAAPPSWLTSAQTGQLVVEEAAEVMYDAAIDCISTKVHDTSPFLKSTGAVSLEA
jgi:hypothetical protein